MMATLRTPARTIPAFATPASMDLRAFQLVINNIREGMQALDARLSTMTQQTGRAALPQGSAAGTTSDLRQQLVELRTQVDELRAAAPPSTVPGAQTLPGTVYLLDMGDGEDGEDGVPGMPGARGVPGPATVIPGEDGEDGEDGVPGMPPPAP